MSENAMSRRAFVAGTSALALAFAGTALAEEPPAEEGAPAEGGAPEGGEGGAPEGGQGGGPGGPGGGAT